MDNFRKKPPAPDTRPPEARVERRRIGRIVHDDRGNASVDWLDAPSDYKRQVFKIVDDPADALALEKSKQTFNPYEASTLPEPRKTNAPRKDLRKLSEWIKMMRDLEERKRTGGED
jgi:hypothetical protein